MRHTLRFLGTLICIQPSYAQAQDVAPQDATTPHVASRPTLEQALARYAHEPTIEQVLRAALASHHRVAPDFDSMATRARWSGAVPQVGLSARHGQGIRLSDSSESTDESLKLATDDDLTLGATLTFDLGKLVFAREEVAITREARAAQSSVDTRLREVVRVYFMRRRLQLERDMLGKDDIEHAVQIAEATALLTTFTNGAFERLMASSTDNAEQTRTP
jgi:hypothetical protein